MILQRETSYIISLRQRLHYTHVFDGERYLSSVATLAQAVRIALVKPFASILMHRSRQNVRIVA